MQSSHFSPSQKRVYLDHNATTAPSPLLKQRWHELVEISGNPSSIHQDARLPRAMMREARAKIAKILGCSSIEIVFNSGASEGSSSIFQSVFENAKDGRNEFLISSVEHPSVMKVAEYLTGKGAVVHHIPVSREGRLDIDFIKQKLSSRTALVSVMFANNETGTLFPIREVADLAHAAGALMHSDCVQLFGKAVCNFNELHLDYATFSAHKFYGLKGTGFCYIKNSSPWRPLVFGSQERHRRGGTENVIGIAALNIVLDEMTGIEEKVSQMQSLRDYFEAELQNRLPGVRVTASESPRLANTSSLLIDETDGETMLMSLDLKGFSVSTGAACSSGSPEPSPVLLAMGITAAEAQSSLRVSLGWSTTREQIDAFIKVLIEVVLKLRALHAEEKKRVEVG